MSTNKRIRGSALQKLRREFFRHSPLCVHCYERGLIRAAKEVDHIIALCNGGTDTPDNRQGLCIECHSEKTRKDRGLSTIATGLDGWPIQAGPRGGVAEKFLKSSGNRARSPESSS